MSDGHSLRCERSKTDPRRCRCECKGRAHGVAAVRERLGIEEQTEEAVDEGP